ncbi:ER lumen protein-retaining receptor [Pseudozyma hubeiensis]|nr:ER lumen protein-retaining receptor [Pseudozyma hubeiensis]
MPRHIEIIVNPASGSRLSQSLLEQHILPLLSSFPHRVRSTESAGDAIRLGSEIVQDHPTASRLDVISIGGDGTTHELLNGLYLNSSNTFSSSLGSKVKVRLAIVPAGTANALYSAMYANLWTQELQTRVASAKSISELEESVVEVMLKSVRSLVAEDEEKLWSLPLMLNRLEEEGRGETLLVSHLVTSHALHAAILHDADTPQMRERYEGIERFKAAAQANATRWVRGSVTLNGRAGEGVERYSPAEKKFKPFEQGKEKVQLKGPFLYLNAMVTDRLESSFLPAPLSGAFATDGLPLDAVDVVVIRPRRDRSLDSLGEDEAAIKFAESRLGKITVGMYSGGKHVDMVYGEDEPVVEYFRCSGYVFTPEEGKEEEGGKEKLVCTDGFISESGRTTVSRWTDGQQEQQEGAGSISGGIAAPLVWC